MCAWTQVIVPYILEGGLAVSLLIKKPSLDPMFKKCHPISNLSFLEKTVGLQALEGL